MSPDQSAQLDRADGRVVGRVSSCFCSAGPRICSPSCWRTPGWLVHKEQALPDAHSRINTLAARGRIRADAVHELRAWRRCTGTARRLPNTAGGVLGELAGKGSARGLSFLGATLLLLGLWLAGVALFLGVSWFDDHGQARRLGTQGHRLGAGSKSSRSRELASGQQRKQARKEVVRERAEESREPAAPADRAAGSCPEKSERVEQERQVPLFDAPKPSELPPLSLLDEPPPREQCLFRRSAGGVVAPGGDEAARTSASKSEVVAVQPGPVITRFELRPAPGVKASQISNLRRISRARCPW